MEDIHRHTVHRGTHEKESGGGIYKALLISDERHPACVRRASHTAVKPQPVVANPGMANSSRDAQVTFDWLRKMSDVGLHHETWIERLCQTHGDMRSYCCGRRA